jgi:class 3 adenylate cyclase/tetratricopeptide (TPR) repeat protein
VTEERRLVTILFADVVGSTALGESLDPEDLRSLLSRYFAIAREVVASHGGTLEKFIGDAVMAVFGLPSAHGDDPARALAAALELRDTVRGDAALVDRLPLRIGVNTGDVVATRETSGGEFLITGDAVNTTARLEQAAEPWQILVGERTVRSAGETFQFEGAIGVEAKGKAAPVPARVLAGRTVAPPRRHLPLVGREDDLAQLELVAKRAFGEQRPYLVSVIAPAGTGKTRLLEEFLDHLPRLADAVVAITQCLPYGQRLTYAPLRSLLLRVLDLRGDPSADAIRTAARDWLSEAGDANAARSADLLVATLGSGEVEGIDRAAIFAAWRSVVERTANQRPLVLVIEDLHWSSDSLLDLIEAILQPRGAAPILMLVLARPELLDRRPTWGGGRRNYVALALEPLGDASVATLVGDLLGQASPAVASRVVARAEGNPFYAGEIVRSILERAPTLEPIAVDTAMASLPDTVQATVLARIDLLEPAARRTLQVGSVFGRAFPVGGLAAVDPGLEGDAEGIDQLVERDLIRPAIEDDFQFRHILIREVAYGTLPRAERSRLHAAAADYLANRADGRGDELAELIAYHYREAASVGSLLGPVPDHVRSAAVTWLRRASDAAMAGAANYEAARHLRSAIDLAEPGDLPELYEHLGDVLIAGDEALDAYDAATRAAKAEGRGADDLLRLVSSQLLVMTRWHGSVATYDAERVLRLLAEAKALVPAAADPRQQARFEIASAFMPHLHHGETTAAEIEAAKAAGGRAIDYARRVGDPNLISEALDSLGSAELELDNYETVVGIARERLELDDRLNIAERMDARTVLAWCQATLGQIAESLATARSVTALLGPGQALSFQLGALAWQISALHILGRWDEALAVVRRLEEAWIGTDRTAAGYALQGWVAGLEVARARREGALVDALRSEFEDLSGRFGEGTRPHRQGAMAKPDLEAVARDIIGSWRLWTERMDQLDRPILVCSDRRFLLDPKELRAIIAYMDDHHVRVVAAQARRALGLATGDPDPLRAALEAFESVGAVPYAARVQADLGALTGDAGLSDSGIARLEALGDVDHLARLAARRA